MSDISSVWLAPIRPFHKRKEHIKLPPKVKRLCAAVLEQCQNEARANDYCWKHDKRNRRYGTPYMVKPERQLCAAILDDCPDYARELGYCKKHCRRLRRTGSPYLSKKGRPAHE